MEYWSEYSFVIRGSNRKKVLQSLEKPMIPTQIASKTKLHLSHVSRALNELESKGLVECVTPDERVGRVYRLTEKGNIIKIQVVS